MAVTVLVRGGGTLYWLADGRRIVAREAIDADPVRMARTLARGYLEVPEPRRLGWVRASGAEPMRAEPALARAIRAAGGVVEAADTKLLRRARESVPSTPVASDRDVLLAFAREAARLRLAGPDETLVALAREESRLERALGREQGALAQWVSAPDGALAEHAEGARRFAELFAEHHAAVERRLQAIAERHVPNLARLVGAKVAGRLLAAAGSRRALSRVSGARLQLLGSRRRPDPKRGPRFGVLYRAPGLEELPDQLQGRFARSLAALAVIAVRADEFTHRDLGDLLVRRRDRRRTQLLGRGR